MNAEQLLTALERGAYVRETARFNKSNRCKVHYPDGSTAPVQATAIRAALARLPFKLIIRQHLMAHYSDYVRPEYETGDPQWIVRRILEPRAAESVQK